MKRAQACIAGLLLGLIGSGPASSQELILKGFATFVTGLAAVDPVADSDLLPLVRGGATKKVAASVLVPTATTLRLGKVKPDGSTITISVDGTISATSGAAGISQLTGDVTAGPGVGSQAATLAASGVSAGTYTKITVDAKGRATVGATAACADLSDDGQGCSSTARAANAVLAGPTSGGDAAPTFRALVSGDLTGTLACADLSNDGEGCSTATRSANTILAGPGSGSAASPAFRALVAADMPATPLSAGTSVSLAGPRQYYVCTGTCTVTPPVPVAGYEFCVVNDNNVATVITLAALGSSARYENTARTAYGTAGTGTFVSGGAVGDKVCIVGLDSTHYLTATFNGTWTAN